jgi:hypothetical protein
LIFLDFRVHVGTPFSSKIHPKTTAELRFFIFFSSSCFLCLWRYPLVLISWIWDRFWHRFWRIWRRFGTVSQ